MSTPPFTVTAMDHIVLRVRDLEAVLHFYGQVLGLQPERLEAFRRGEAPFPSLRVSADTVIDLLPVSAPPAEAADLDHFCLVLATEDVAGLVAYLRAHGVPVEEGPVPRWGARGMGTSVYCRDPENRRLELRTYPG
ncbi:MAG: lactoylglutathione lyase [Candidatus Tectimicrobiota bacterium]|nr:MAG: lactoylglutathione lyase [Candidatus Tectomicrobia bacterium]